MSDTFVCDTRLCPWTPATRLPPRRNNLKEQLKWQAGRMVVNACLFARNLPIYIKRWCHVVALDALLRAAQLHHDNTDAWPDPSIEGHTIKRSAVTRIAHDLFDLIDAGDDGNPAGVLQQQWPGLDPLPQAEQEAAKGVLHDRHQGLMAVLHPRGLWPLARLASELERMESGGVLEAR